MHQKILRKKNHTIFILGPTASGKSDMAIALAKKYDGEVISADSRQVYRGMDIGTGKVAKDRARKSKIKNKKSALVSAFFSEGIRHHLLDIASPKRNYNVTHFVRDAKKAITDIRKRDKVPIICGGTGFWAQALIEGVMFPAVKPDAVLRKKLGKKSAVELFKMLIKKDPARAKTIDRHNKFRLIRALEIIATLGAVPPLPKSYKLPAYRRGRKAASCTIIALNPDKTMLRKNIDIRLKKRLRQGMIEEVERLHKEGISWKRLESFGLEYRNIALFLQKKISRQTMRDNILRESFQYAKRQLTWLRRFEKMGAKIHWITDPKQATTIIAIFL